MFATRAIHALAGAALGAALFVLPGTATAQDKVIRIGVIYDYTGPYAAGGYETHAWGTKLAIDMINERGGVAGYKIKATYADAPRKTDVDIHEAERMLTQHSVAQS